MMELVPNEQAATTFVEQATGEKVATIERFATGLSHYVYDVTTTSGQSIVVRMSPAANRKLLAAAVYWSERLRPLGVPLPALLKVDLEGALPALLLERLPGTDLAYVYPRLNRVEKQALARQVVTIQEQVAKLPLGQGYGYVQNYEQPFPAQSWAEVVQQALVRSQTRIVRAGLVSSELIEQVRQSAGKLEDYFATVPAQPFLDDLTTKNVLIYQHRLSGVVDVDWVCFGDRLFTIALTRTALLSRNYDTDYIDLWCAELELNLAQRQALDFYTALFCLDFLSEFGQTFNQTNPVAPDQAQIARLTSLIQQLL